MKQAFFIVVVFLCAALKVSAQESANASAFYADFVADIESVEDKVLQLAEAVPADKYSWRPAEGVRSISETYMHIAGANYFLLTFLGAKAPEGLTMDTEKNVTDKAEVIKWVKESYQAVKDFAGTMTEEQLNEEVDFFNEKFTKRRMIFALMTHSHEHLGQSIAYARSINITPPWSM